MDRKVVIVLAIVLTVILLCCCSGGALLLMSRGGPASATVEAAKGSDDPVKLTALQLALEETVWSYQRAKALTALALSAHSSDMTVEKWDELYAEALGTWAHAEESAKRLEALAAKVPERTVPAPPAASALPRRARELASRAGALLTPGTAYAQDAPAPSDPLDIEQWRVSDDDSVSLDQKQTKEALAVLAERAPVVLAYEAAPSGSKLAEAAKYLGGDARKARDILAGNYQEMRASYNQDEKRAEIAWRTATAIEGACDVALFVGDLATGGGKVALTKSLSKTLLKRLANPKLLLRTAREQLREKTFTTIVGHVDMLVGLYNKGVVIATGDDSAGFSLTGDVASGLSTLIGLKSLRDKKGALDNLTQMATSPGGWKTAFGWGSTTASLTQKGVNALEASMGDDGATLTPRVVTFTESPNDADVAQYALRAAEPALQSLMAEGSAFDERYGEVMAAWSSRETFGVKLGPPQEPQDGETPETPEGSGALTVAEMRQAYADWMEVQLTAVYRAMATPGSMLNEQRPDAAERWVRITPMPDGSFRNEQGNSKGQDMDKPLDPIPWAPTYATWEAWAKRQDPDRFRAWADGGFKPDVWKGKTAGAGDI